MFYDLFYYLYKAFYIGFPIYVVLDFFKTKAFYERKDDSGVILGFKRALIAWGLKIFVMYWLFITGIMWTQNILLYFKDNGIQYHYATFQSEKVSTDVQIKESANNQIVKESDNDTPIIILVQNGMLELSDSRLYWVNLIFSILMGNVNILFCLLLFLIIRPVALRKPFAMANVWKLRVLAVIILLDHFFRWLYDKINDFIVMQHFYFPSTDTMEIHEVSYPMTFMLCLSIFVIAEIIRVGAELKEEQDLTV